jgi:eukaryotic-like serine/threonine-protein kinase
MVDEGDAVVTVAHAPEVPGYELGALLARGGTSEVWAGVALDGGRRVAVKVVHADLGSVEAASREAAVSARVASAHVVGVEACVPLTDGRVAVVMPHLLGGAVDALVRHRGHLSPGEVVTVLAPVASALGRLHDLGVVHGDVSPGNVLLDLDGRPVLGDLGLGHVVGDVSPGVWGTDGYVAPEVLLGADPTPASDVYALGAVGWLCLSGTVPGPPGLRPELAQVSLAGEGSEPVVAALAAAVSAEPADRPGAHELAWLLFGAAEPEPLRLVAGDDEVSAVTYRLRAAAGRPPSGAASPRWRWSPLRVPWSPPRMPWGRGAVPARVEGRDDFPGHRWRRRGGHAARHAGDVVRRAPRLSREAVGSGLLAAVLVALLVLTVAALGPEGGTARARPAAGTAAGAGDAASAGTAASTLDAASATSTGRTGRTDPRTDVAAPRTRPAELLGVLADARAAAWREATPSLLGAADAPRSAVAARDSAAVAEVARAGVRYTGLRYTVAEVATVSATPDRAVLRARVDAGGYTVTAATGSTSRPARPGAPVLVDLVRTEVGWRMSDLRPAP